MGGVALHTCVLAVCIVTAALISYMSATTAVCYGHGIRRHVGGCVGYKGVIHPSPHSPFLQHLMCSGLVFVSALLLSVVPAHTIVTRT